MIKMSGTFDFLTEKEILGPEMHKIEKEKRCDSSKSEHSKSVELLNEPRVGVNIENIIMAGAKMEVYPMRENISW